LHSNTVGASNTAEGVLALEANISGSNNTGSGFQALENNTLGNTNTAIGQNALVNNTTGSSNIALGASAGSSLTTGSNNICLGALGAGGESNTMRLGRFGAQTKTFIAGVSGGVVPGGVTVIVDNLGHMSTTTSSARYSETSNRWKKRAKRSLV
jgi:hypothetical protein